MRPGYRAIDSLIDELELNPEWRAALVEARKQIARDFYQPSDPHYARLMRGERPDRSAHQR